ncbi:hypothetical protein [Alkalibacillus aidingensis]|uniref:hypothetical protein n=1 Tax=Alkalibacillus aidingensis TaxID=2747607 RepID=UPI0016607A6E|nr:hypothetical protein [Alkalibacillus aidingensis]
MNKKFFTTALASVFLVTSAFSVNAEDSGEMTVSGDVEPTVIDFSVPTETTFSINPNEDEGETFVAPEFEIENHTNAPISLSINTFEHKDLHEFENVAIDEFEDWKSLTVSESEQYLYLNLLPSDSTEWLDETAGFASAHDVQDSEYEMVIGSMEENSSVNFEIDGKHGYGFTSPLETEYTVEFLFELQ